MSPTVLDKGALDKGVDQLILSDPGLKPLFNSYAAPELKIEKNYLNKHLDILIKVFIK